MRSFLPALLAGTASAGLLPPSKVVRQESGAPTVTLDYCTLTPAASSTTAGLYKYQNIRFAAVPTGNLRFALPSRPIEDCLYMDIYVPANAANKSLPVLVWTYGGGFTGGSKSENTPEGLFDLSGDFIFVSYNYRLGITGLANGPTLLHQGGTSNTGLWDVQHAFQWVNKYIANFGGNPDEITAMGFSAGAS
ncbi:hypothetical protein LA080_001804 [Diaporthe eres]|uniref:Carboxylesterase type B domain-containing protein n=1 Tax=Diaporthe vaccinii TaxID=105482 RepID=A0ABR4F291_9PEZI|nr:hypothetical protein LA080_001804 [Diaporthe eres]